MGGEAFATRNKLNLRMDLAIGRKPDYRPVGYMAHDEGRKSIKQTPSNKVRVISRGQGRGLAAGFGKVSMGYSSESSRLGSQEIS